MKRNKIQFENRNGEKLEGYLDLPEDQPPRDYAIFAHCFTCNKNLTAIRNINRSLTLAGFGVLRFDFTGLGESEGDFTDTNFSSNVEDLVVAANYIEKEYKAPAVLVGHSLGGAATIFAADLLPKVKAVATIGAPSNPGHVKHLIESNRAEVIKNGKAEVNIGGRSFVIKKQFLEDLENKPMEKIVHDLNKALLIMHSPQDTTVGIENAERIYKAAKHPKRFVMLDDADYLLMNKADSLYAGQIIGSWVARYI